MVSNSARLHDPVNATSRAETKGTNLVTDNLRLEDLEEEIARSETLRIK